MRIALANIRYPETPDASVDLAKSAIADAARAGAQIIAFPECYVPGYRIGKAPRPPIDQGFLDNAWQSIANSARDANLHVILGTERLVDGKPRLTALVINADGTSAGFQDKIQLDPSEDTMYSIGSERQIFRAGDLTFGIAICHEGWRYPETVRWAARRGAQIVFHPHFAEAEGDSFRPTSFADPRNTFHEKALLCRAAENTIYFASVNCVGEGSPITSAIAAPDGSVLAWQPYGQEGLLVADLDLSLATGSLASRCRS